MTIFAIAGVFLTILGIFGGEAVAYRLKLGPLSILSLGWMLGMIFTMGITIAAKLMGAQ
jgi:hypothetical protein